MKLQEVLPILNSEPEIQAHYQRFIEDNFKGCLPFRKLYREFGIESDGILEHLKLGLKILSEFKFKRNILDRIIFCKCLIQVIYYLKKIEILGERFPNIILIADEKTCYCFHSEYILTYLDFKDVDWSISPSKAPECNPTLLKSLMDDRNTIYYAYHIATVDLQEIIKNINELNKYGVERKVKINMKNIERFFNEFTNQVVINAKNRFNANEIVGIFMNIINYPTEVYLHPKKKNILVVKNTEVPINSVNYQAFFSHVHEIYTPKEGDDLNAICDRLINDLDRRFKGEFYTPTIWVDEAHRMIEQEFGPNWKEEYVVWDPAWGTGNLTRDYNFKELYCSTINESDLKIGERYNPNAVKFQYDFLNDDVYPEGLIGVDQIEDKLTRLAPGLVKALRENRKIIIFMNPPYGVATPFQPDLGGLTKSKIKDFMNKQKLGFDAGQLYNQFIYRIIDFKRKFNLKNINIVMFTLPGIISSTSYSGLRNVLYKELELKNSMLFNAGYFSNTASSWGVLFSIFGNKNTGNNLLVNIKDIDKDQTIIVIGKRNFYKLDENDQAKEWCKLEVKNLQKIDFPQLSSPINVKQKGDGKVCKEFLGYIQHTQRISDCGGVCIFSGAFSIGRGFPIIKENFYKCVVTFCAQKSVIPIWFNIQDEFCKPGENNVDFDKYMLDSSIYSLFNPCSYQSSLRNIIYKNKQWNIFNEFFWLSNQYMQDLANQHGFTELYQDAKTFNKDRFVYNELQKVLSQLSPDAVAVLNKANELVEKSFIERKNIFYIHPEWHLEAWDAGWYQIKLILKEKFPEDLKEFRLLYRAFEERMREGVYKFGFLR